MKYYCEAAFVMSREIDGGVLKEIFTSEDIRKFLKKGAPEGALGTEIKKTEIKGREIRLFLESDRYVRASSALLRLRGHIEKNYGQKLRAGIKELRIEKLIIEGIELEKEPKEEMKISFFAEKIEIKGKMANITFRNITPELLENNIDGRMIELVQEKALMQHYVGKEETKQIKWKSKEKKMMYGKDPSLELEKTNWIRRTSGKGQFVYAKNFTSLANALKGIMKDFLYDPLGFEEMLFPKFEPWHVPKKSGHCKNIYPVAYFVMVPKNSDPKNWEEEMDYFKLTGEVYNEGIMKKVQPFGIMSYAQCPPFWQYLEGKTISMESLPIKVFDWSGPTYRNESGGTHGIERIEEFHRSETLFVGTDEQVGELVCAIEEKLTHIFEKIMDLEIRTFEVAPWWLVQEGSVKIEEKFKGAKTVDFEAYLPYRGEREKGEWLEIQNVSNNGKKYPANFSVKAQKGDLWSGCAGGSLERWICAFLSQKGFDETNWPVEVKKRFNKSEEVKFL